MVMSSLSAPRPLASSHLFRGARRTVPGSYSGKRKSISGVIEVHQLLQALDVAVMEELLLEVRPGSLGGRDTEAEPWRRCVPWMSACVHH